MSAKRKLEKFAQNKTFEHFFEPQFNFQNPSDYEMKANWAKDFFKNKNSLIVELGCGKGEYTVGQAKQYPQNNYIGVDIKGARMWRGASDVLNLGLKNFANAAQIFEDYLNIKDDNDILFNLALTYKELDSPA
ncbi:MAG: hypothetical protein KBG30_11315, partial [Bacteroidales bacterium]|nr:hypothetical protein [Bacteroidales bacterium]